MSDAKRARRADPSLLRLPGDLDPTGPEDRARPLDHVATLLASASSPMPFPTGPSPEPPTTIWRTHGPFDRPPRVKSVL